jgi:hypothetical protein
MKGGTLRSLVAGVPTRLQKVMTPYGMKRRRKRKRREFETAGGTKKRSPAKDEQPLPPPSHERGDAALFKDLR